MKKFAKVILIENETKTVNASVDECEDGDGFVMNVNVENGGIIATIGFGYNTHEEALNALEKLDSENAEAIARSVFGFGA